MYSLQDLRNTPGNIWEIHHLRNTLLQSEKYSLHHHNHLLIGCKDQREQRPWNHITGFHKHHNWLVFHHQPIFSENVEEKWLPKSEELVWSSNLHHSEMDRIQMGSKIFANFPGDEILLLTAPSRRVWPDCHQPKLTSHLKKPKLTSQLQKPKLTSHLKKQNQN